jgi:maltooligosyltrehalose trehalohydrolase
MLESGPGTGFPTLAALEPDGDGYWSVVAPQVKAGTLYRYRLDGEIACPDPASRFQPDGPHGSSMVVDPCAFAWTDHDWPGVALEGQVVYEMHIGTFTREGTWAAATREIAELARIGVTLSS